MRKSDYRQLFFVEVEVEGDWRQIEPEVLGAALPPESSVETLQGWYKGTCRGQDTPILRDLMKVCQALWAMHGTKVARPAVAAFLAEQASFLEEM